MAVRARGWLFIVQLGNINDVEPNAKSLISDETYRERFVEFCVDARYCIFQREIGPNTGNIHLQGFVYFDNKKSLSQLVDYHMFGLALHPSFRVMSRNSSIAKNVVYCSKEESRVAGAVTMEVGDRPRQGARNDIPDVIAFMVENATMTWTQIAQAEPRVAGMMR